MTLTSVVAKPSGLFVITDSTGVKHATKSPWLASLADRFLAKGCEVELFSVSGWWYRDLWSIREAGVKDEPMAVICAWCKTVITDGAQPVSHGICQACSDAALADLDTKAGRR